MMTKRRCMDLSPSVQASLASRQYISTVSKAADGNTLGPILVFVLW